jgi:hypothetical protein
VIQFALAFSIWKFSKLFDPVIIRKEKVTEEEPKEESITEEEPKEESITEEEPEKEPEEELISDDSNNNRITNIYISDSVINRSIIGDKDDKDE